MIIGKRVYIPFADSLIFLKLSLGISYSTTKRTKLSEESISIKRKHSDGKSSVQRNGVLSKSDSYDASTKTPKPNVSLAHDSSTVDINDASIGLKDDLLYPFRKHKLIVLFIVVLIGQNLIGFTVHLPVFVVISMKHYKRFNEAKEW